MSEYYYTIHECPRQYGYIVSTEDPMKDYTFNECGYDTEEAAIAAAEAAIEALNRVDAE